MRYGALLLLAVVLAACSPRLQPPGHEPGPPRIEAGLFVAADGARLPLRRWTPRDPEGAAWAKALGRAPPSAPFVEDSPVSPNGDPVEPGAVVIALHGMNDYGNAFAAVAPYLARGGVTLYALDQRGFGQAPFPGRWAGTEAMVRDVRDLAEALGARYPGRPLYLLGLSMGGAVAMVAIGGADPAPVDGAVLVAPAVWGRTTMGFVPRAALWLMSHTVPWMPLTARGLNITPSDNREMLIALGRDPLVIKQTRVDAVHGIVGLMDAALEASPDLRRPTLILYGERDEIIPRGPTARMLETLGPDGVQHRIAIHEAGYHMLLRDKNARPVWDDILAWLRDPAGPLPSGADDRGDPVAILRD